MSERRNFKVIEGGLAKPVEKTGGGESTKSNIIPIWPDFEDFYREDSEEMWQIFEEQHNRINNLIAELYKTGFLETAEGALLFEIIDELNEAYRKTYTTLVALNDDLD